MRSTSIVIFIIFVSILLASCGTSVEEPLPTVIPTDTQIPTQPPPPTETPTPIPEPTSTAMAITTFEGLAGQWRRADEGYPVTISIKEDGEATATGLGFVTLWWEEGLLHWKEVPEEGCPGTAAIYRIEGVPGEYIKIKKIEDPCNRRGVTGFWPYFSP